jgi:hypothetical protein
MRTAEPATGATFAFKQFLTASTNASRPGLYLLGIFDPTDELIAGKGRNVFP